jgi:hypothetical protein
VGSAAAAALSSVIAKVVYTHNHFVSSLALFGLGNLVYCLILLVISGSVRKGFMNGIRPKKKRTVKKIAGSGGALILFNSILGGAAGVVLNLAIKLGSVTLVNGLRGLQYAGVFLITLLMSRHVPRLLKEELSGQTMRQKLAAIVIVAVGLGLLTLMPK